jgi:hypothetical protein
VAETGGKQPLAVVVHDHRPIDDFVPAVVVHICDGEAVIALT